MTSFYRKRMNLVQPLNGNPHRIQDGHVLTPSPEHDSTNPAENEANEDDDAGNREENQQQQLHQPQPGAANA